MKILKFIVKSKNEVYHKPEFEHMKYNAPGVRAINLRHILIGTSQL